MPDTYTEIRYKTHGQRLGSSIAGAIICFIFLILFFHLFIYIEHDAKLKQEGLGEIGRTLRTISGEVVEPASHGKVVLLGGSVKAGEKLKDPALFLELDAPKVERNVEMYQWYEKTDKTETVLPGGGSIEKKTYTYDKKWSSELIRSSSFHKQEYVNPQSMLFEHAKFIVPEARLEKFMISETHIDSISSKPLPLGNIPLPLKAQFPGRISLTKNGEIFIGKDQESPAIGDHRISYTGAVSDIYTVVGRQDGDRIMPYVCGDGATTLSPMRCGKYASGEMIQLEKTDLKSRTWGWRLSLAFFYLVLIFFIVEPIAVLADIVPPAGSFTRLSNLMLSLFLAAGLFALSIGVGRFFYAPVMGTSKFVVEMILRKLGIL
ncbi:MAG TPA: hypothetical protein DCZ94_12140 [Lentisphaeria bacterium]|nr:MAG: hypothetical protein A2X48_12725 [Lentisphaerae bacterium GWF2_49_21]HBC87699.1 hypothetical protein [Lentisphaeria bacterium]